MIRRPAHRDRDFHRGTAAVELAVLLPFLSAMFVVGLDYGRLFYAYVVINNCAVNGALYACNSLTQSNSPYTSVSQAALADATDLNPQPTVSTANGNDANGNAYIDVTVTYTFNTITNYPLLPNQWTFAQGPDARDFLSCPDEVLMLRQPARQPRPGTTMVEAAMVYSATFLLLFGLMVGGLGVFRYQEVALVAREGARYAAVRGSTYQSETSNAAPTSTTVLNNAVLPKAGILSPSQLSCTLTYNSNNTVTVTATYNWFAEAYLVGPITMKSTSTMPVSY